MTTFHIRNADGAQAVVAGGYFYNYPPNCEQIANRLHGSPIQMSNDEYARAKDLHLNGQTAVDAELSALPMQIPVTVQGASEQFITSGLLQVQNRVDTNSNALNLQIVNSKNQIINAING